MRCLPRRISQRISVDENPHGRRLRPLPSRGRSVEGSQGRARRARGARDEPGAGVVIVAAAVQTVGMGGSGPGHASSEENLKWGGNSIFAPVFAPSFFGGKLIFLS